MLYVCRRVLSSATWSLSASDSADLEMGQNRAKAEGVAKSRTIKDSPVAARWTGR